NAAQHYRLPAGHAGREKGRERSQARVPSTRPDARSRNAGDGSEADRPTHAGRGLEVGGMLPRSWVAADETWFSWTPSQGFAGTRYWRLNTQTSIGRIRRS